MESKLGPGDFSLPKFVKVFPDWQRRGGTGGCLMIYSRHKSPKELSLVSLSSAKPCCQHRFPLELGERGLLVLLQGCKSLSVELT